MPFGEYVRSRREALRQGNPAYSVRKVADRVGLEPSYLSRIQRGDEAPPSEQKIALLAQELGEDPDLLLVSCAVSSVTFGRVHVILCA
jgi:transcriptional regulator with XRE-family HTH domain